MSKTSPKSQANATASAPSIAILAQYIKDLSFESPNPLQAFTAQSEAAPSISVNVQAHANKLGNNNFEVMLEFHAEAKRDKEVMFVVELTYGGIVTISGLPEEQAGPLVMVDCPHLLFPFARNILADVTRDGGFPPLYLSPIDFAGLYNQKTSEKTAEKEAS